jgi:hypothetical protein
VFPAFLRRQKMIAQREKTPKDIDPGHTAEAPFAPRASQDEHCTVL